jgi:uncharacterized membrane protein YeiH
MDLLLLKHIPVACIAEQQHLIRTATAAAAAAAVSQQKRLMSRAVHFNNDYAAREAAYRHSSP